MNEKEQEQAAMKMIDDAFEDFEGAGGAGGLLPFGAEMIEIHLHEHGLKFYRGEDKSFLFELETPHGYDLRAYLSCEGTLGQVCAVRVTARAHIARADWGRAAFACNEWMRAKRWPRAFLDIEDAATSASAELNADGHHDFEPGATQAQVSLFLNHIIAASIEFFEWAKNEKKLF